MSKFEQALKFLDPIQFEQLCFDLLRSKYPQLDIKRVHGAGGDEGIDCFSGQLEIGAIIWQSKYFLDFKPSQRAQVLSSLRTAMRKHSPHRWVLCIPITFTIKTQLWWTKLQRAYIREGTALDLYDGASISHDLLNYHTVAKAYFPALVSNIDELRALADPDVKEPSQIKNRATASADALRDHLEELDGRFSYEIVYGRTWNADADLADRPGLLASVRDSGATVNVFAKDISALRLDPPAFKIKIKPQALSKYDELIRKGGQSTFSSDELIVEKHPFSRLWPDLLTSESEIVIGNSCGIRKDRRHFRIGVKGRDAGQVLQYVPFELVRKGTEELEFQSCDSRLGLALTLAITESGKTVSFGAVTRLAGHSFETVLRAMEFLDTLQKDALLQIFDLETSQQWLEMPLQNAISPDFVAQLRDIARKAIVVSAIFNVPLTMPSSITEKDAAALEFYHQAATTKSALIGITGASATLVKTMEKADFAMFKNRFRVAFEVMSYTPPFELFGRSIPIGPGVISAENLQVRDFDRFQSIFNSTSIGKSMQVEFGESEALLRIGEKPSDKNLYIANQSGVPHSHITPTEGSL